MTVNPDRASAQIRDGSIVYEQARPGQTLDRGVVLDSISGSCVRLHHGSNSFTLCKGDKVLT